MALTTRPDPIRLDFQSVQQVVVTANDGDRWVTTVRDAAFACRSAVDETKWRNEFEQFLAHINKWSQSNSEIVVAAFVGVGSEGLTGVIVTKGNEYRLDFDDQITALDIELANQFPNCRADILHTPADEPESRVPFLVLENAIQVYGN